MNSRLKNGYGMVSSTIMRDPAVSLREKGIYAYLATYADGENSLTVGVNRAAAECGVDPSTIRRILDVLRKKGIIVRESRSLGSSYITRLLK